MSSCNNEAGKLRIWLKSALGLILIGGLVLLVFFGQSLNLDEVLDTLQSWGIFPFYIGLVIFPLIGAPITPFYLLAGAAFPLGWNILFLALSLVVHFNLAYLLSAHLLRKTILRMLARTRYSLPEVKPDNHWQVALWVRLAPGLAVALKNYILGAIGIRYGVFMVVSWTTTFVFSLLVLLLGRSALEGQWIWFAAILAGLFLLGLVIRKVGSRLSGNNCR